MKMLEEMPKKGAKSRKSETKKCVVLKLFRTPSDFI